MAMKVASARIAILIFMFQKGWLVTMAIIDDSKFRTL